MASDAALCNDLLRTWTSQANFNQVFPTFAGAAQVDHFFEVQHVVNILFGSHDLMTSGTFFKVPVGYFFDIATFISGRSNLFLISAADNQAKKNITWDKYRPEVRPIFLQNYLKLHVGTDNHGPTVFQTVQDLAVTMATRQGTYAYLTRAVGQAICQQMGFDLKLSVADHRKLGDFDRQVWQ
jgi:hypothetical protein